MNYLRQVVLTSLSYTNQTAGSIGCAAMMKRCAEVCGSQLGQGTHKVFELKIILFHQSFRVLQCLE